MKPWEYGLQIQSLVRKSGALELSLIRAPTPPPADDEVVVRVEAAPINPSDLGLLFGSADLSTARASRSLGLPALKAIIPQTAMKSMSARVDQPMGVGNEGAGIVVDAGNSEASQSLLGKTVATMAGAMYAQYRCIKATEVLQLTPGISPRQGASSFINPLTVLGMVETMRRDGHRALVHTAAASNVGQMLNRLCNEEGIEIVNIVRNKKQVDLLRSIGARYVCDTSIPSFLDDLIDAISRTGATVAFDAIGGGPLANEILTCISVVLNGKLQEYRRYGSDVRKHVYIYGNLDARPTEISRSFGTAWGISDWLVFDFLKHLEPIDRSRLLKRIVSETATTFSTHYSRTISMSEMLEIANVEGYSKRGTGDKYLLEPQKNIA